jgi:hypothetical protein
MKQLALIALLLLAPILSTCKTAPESSEQQTIDQQENVRQRGRM